MNRIMGAALGIGALAAVAALAVLRTGSEDSGDGEENRVERLDDEHMPLADGRNEEHDPLGAAHTLSPHGAEQARGAERRVAGKATSAEREGMYTDLSGVGVSGSQGSDLGQEDRNPVGPHA